MLDALVVLGQVPGTNYYITFTQVMIVALSAILLYWERLRHRQIVRFIKRLRYRIGVITRRWKRKMRSRLLMVKRAIISSLYRSRRKVVLKIRRTQKKISLYFQKRWRRLQRRVQRQINRFTRRLRATRVVRSYLVVKSVIAQLV